MQKEVTQGGAKIIELRRRSSFQSPAYLAVKMIEAAMGGEEFNYPAGTYADTARYNHVMMAMPTRVTSDGVYTKPVIGSADEIATLDASYDHLQKMRDQVIEMGALPAVAEWNKLNANL
jgi:malate dehydrogenase